MAWDRSKPATNQLAVSAEVRAQWDAIARSLGGINLLADPIFEIWPAGDAAVPAHWTLTGAGAAIARAGSGLGDTNRKVGDFCAKVTAGGGAVAQLAQNLLDTTSYDDGFDGLSVSFGAWVRSNTNNGAKVGIADGVGTTYNDTTGTFLTANTWTWLSGTRVIDGAATKIQFVMDVTAALIGYLSGPTVILGEVQPLYSHPGAIVTDQTIFFLAGSLSGLGGTVRKIGSDRYFHRPWIVRGVQCAVQTAPVPSGADVIVDINHFDGSVQQTMFTTKPRIVAGTAIGTQAAPDGTYRYRCFEAAITASQTDRLLTMDIDQVGSGNPGVDLYIMVRFAYYARPLEAHLLAGVTN